MIKKLSKKYKLFIISSCSEKNINLYLKNNNIDNLFIEVLGRETNFSKIEKFKTVFQKYNTNSKNCIFITDTLGDIKEANKVKIDSLAVTWGYHEKERLKKENPKYIINKPNEIINNLINTI